MPTASSIIVSRRAWWLVPFLGLVWRAHWPPTAWQAALTLWAVDHGSYYWTGRRWRTVAHLRRTRRHR